MRKVYRNPKELATCLKDLVDTYLEELVSYDVLKEKVKAIVNANEERAYKNGHIPVKLSNIIGNERVKIIEDILKED